MSDDQGPLGSGKSKKRDDEEQEGHQPEEQMEQEPDQAGKDDVKGRWIVEPGRHFPGRRRN